MLKRILTLLLLFSCMAASAQSRRTKEFDQKLFDAKLAEMVYQLDISDSQKKAFAPIYESYCREIRSAWNATMASMPQGRDNDKDASVERVKKRIKLQEQAQSIRLRYTDKLAEVLTPKQLNKFFSVEDNIQKRLQERKQRSQRQRRSATR